MRWVPVGRLVVIAGLLMVTAWQATVFSEVPLPDGTVPRKIVVALVQFDTVPETTAIETNLPDMIQALALACLKST